MKNLPIDYSRTEELKHGFSIYAEMRHEGTHQIFRTWLLKNGERIGDIRTLFLKCRYDAEKYVNEYIDEFADFEKTLK